MSNLSLWIKQIFSAKIFYVIDKSVYLKKIGRRGKIDIWIVDGEKIRSTIDREFTNFGQHFRFPEIPEYEFWIDKEGVADERKYFIDHLLIEWKLMRGGIPYNEAIEKADIRERGERLKSREVKKESKESKLLQIHDVHKKLWGKTSGELTVWVIDGNLVRSLYYIDFTEGGHDRVYSFVPKNEVWIDNDLVPDERPYVLLHELHERVDMGRGLSYNAAHKRASKIEWHCRHHTKDLTRNLAKLGWTET